jgi:hypothetical protein
MKPPYECKFCGSRSWVEPSDQALPPDYCHPEDHGAPEAHDAGYEAGVAAERERMNAAVAAIEYAVEDTDSGNAVEFLRCWMYGDFEAIREEWPDAPEGVFIDADPLHPETQAAAIRKGE